MAFRAWNRGLALVTSASAATPYGVWEYNGSVWAPNPAFPGSGTCPGNTVLWAGKLDYWVIGSSGGSWPALCRYDGADFVWETVSIPQAALAAVPTQANGSRYPGSITSGACFAWNNCWFFGTYGVVLHWNGTSLTGESTGLGMSPWLEADYQAAATGTGSAGQTLALAVGNATTGSSGNATGAALAAAPGGAAGPTVLQLTGNAFAPSSLAPAGTTRVAVALGGNGDGWITGDSAGPSGPVPQLTAVSAGGVAVDCPNDAAGPVAASLRWSTGSLAVLPDGDALAGGTLVAAGADQPVLADVPCSGSPTLTEFVGPDPTAADPSTAPLVPADEDAGVTSVSVSAANDAWASTGAGQVVIPNSPTGASDPQPPHLYQYTDGQPPDAPAGDDAETRTFTEPTPPTLFSTPPTVIVSPPPAPTITEQVASQKRKTVHLRPSVYDFHFSKPSAAGRGLYRLILTFKVRRPVTLGVEALHGKRVIARSGQRRFSSRAGRLVFLLDPRDWPTGWKVSLARTSK